MRGNAQVWLSRLVRRIESGVDTTFTGIWYTVLLFLMFILVMQFGFSMYVTSNVYNSARAAAQDAAKMIDRDEFLQNQNVILDDGRAYATAAETFERVYGSLPADFDVIAHPSSANMRYVEVRVEIMLSYSFMNSFLNGFGASIGNTPLTISAFAEPAFGIDDEQQ